MAARRPVTTFAELGVPAELTSVLADHGITTPFPIQAATLPHSLAGQDVLGRGRTGSGKTYAFVLPVLARLAAGRTPRRPGRPRALVLVPTRELATQIETAVKPLADAVSLRVATVFGGVSRSNQVKALRAGVDVLVACPGRLSDLINTGDAALDAVEVTVLDEADHMADLGFLPVVRRLLDATPSSGQRLLFSATLDAGVSVLVRRFLTDPVTHSVDTAQSPVSSMSHHVLHIQQADRLAVLAELTAAPGSTVVFTRTKSRARALARQLNKAGVPAVELHGDLGQNARTRNLAAFSDGTAQTLVATDIAARGIHVDGIARVIHADPPVEHKAYLHRSGRTARAGAEGTVITLMTDEQVTTVRDLTRKANIKPVTTRLGPQHPLLSTLAPGERTYVPVVSTPSQPPVVRGGGRKPRTQPGQRQRAGAAASGGGGGARAGAPARTGGEARFSAGAASGRRRAR